MKIPIAISVSDYHEFEWVVDILKQFGETVGYTEIGLHNARYMAVFWRNGQRKKAQPLIDELKKQLFRD